MFKGAYLGKLLRINLTTREYRGEDVNPDELKMLLGGRGLAAGYYFHEIGAELNPFDPENRVIFFTGPLTGLPLPSTTKFQLATKSPETGMYLCSNSGGSLGPQLKRCGYDGLIVEGRSERWCYLAIRDDRVTFADAEPWLGYDSPSTLEAIRDAMDDRLASVLSIGPAAERLVRLSCINVDSRAFGRGGAGAVLGSKRLKGIGIRGSGRIPVADPARIDSIRREATATLKQTRADHTRFGTPQYIEVINELGCMPTRNFQTAYFEQGDKIDAFAMVDHYLEKNYACYRCPVACGKICLVKQGPFAGAHARTEFESIGLLGPNCGVSDFAAIVKANQLCDQLGLDTMSAGHAVALTMELFERGLIGTDYTRGIEARFGSAEALVALIGLIGERKGIGDLLAEGMDFVKSAKPEWADYILEVKGLPLAAYDPRGFHGNGLTYGTSSRGACHNVGGWTIRAELQSGRYDRFALEGKGELVRSIQDNRAYVDSLGICTVVRGSLGFSDIPKGEVLEAATGYGFTPKLMEIGSRIYTMERLILNREGIDRSSDYLPRRISEQPLPSGPTEGRILTRQMYDTMLDEYYRVRGWDQAGKPTRATLETLDLPRRLKMD